MSEVCPLRSERAIALFKEPGTPKEFAAHVADGGSISSFAKSYDVRYHDLYAWVHDSEGVLELYTKALEAREHKHKDFVRDGMIEAADVTVAELYDVKGKMLPPHKLGARALVRMGTRARGIPVIALQGADDRTVNPANLAAIVRQWTDVNAAAPGTSLPVEQHVFAGVGHAWSGGATGVPFVAPTGPDATALILTFLRRHGVLMPQGA